MDVPPFRFLAKGVLVTGTDTGAGKTYVACLLGRRLAAAGQAVRPLKPVESGCAFLMDGSLFPADAAALRDAIAPHLPLDAVCPWPLSAPLSPHLAARLEGASIDPGRVRESIHSAAAASDLVLVEGVGGIAVEMREGYSFADLARDLSLPVLVVAENRLGVLNHLRLTVRYVLSDGLELLGVVLNDRHSGGDPARETNEDEVRRIAGDRYLGRVPNGAAVLPEGIFSRFRELALSRWPSLSL
ncbi:MAG: dethiobiotin synthase [Deltaproteobacteria bacterium]|nr:dethiobiotin synthase [Deltaproteobacteria bacterium]